MSTRIRNSRYSRRRITPAQEPSKAVAAVAAPTSVATPAEAPQPTQLENINLRFGFIPVNDRQAAIEVHEEIWGNKRYYVAALCEEPSICIKALSLREAVGTLVRHLRRSPTIRRYYFEDLPARPRWVGRVGPESFS
jgi:hypothetical protein